MAMANEIIDFELERGRHGELLGREDVMAEIDALMNGAARGWVLVKGSPGLGKSALLTTWLSRREEKGHRVPHHFLRRGVEDWDQPEVVKSNLAAQVEALFPALKDPEARPVTRLRELLQRVSKQVLVPRRERLVLVVDGLDEVDAGADDSNPLQRFLPHVLPPGVWMLCASRPTYPYLNWLECLDGVRIIDLDDQRWAGSNTKVVREYWEQARSSQRFKPPLTTGFVDEVVRRAQGNVLYSLKLAEWLEGQPVENRRAEVLPQGLEKLLEVSWDRIQGLQPELRGMVDEGLGILAVAREALPSSILAEVAGWKEARDQERFLKEARAFLLEEPGLRGNEKAWRPFHESFRSFILESKLGAQRERELHLRLAQQLCRWPVAGTEERFRTSYVLRHGVTHWLKARQWERARGLYTDLVYLEKRCQEAGVLSVEEALKMAGAEAPEEERKTARDLYRAIQAGSHQVRVEPKRMASHVYNWLRCSGWTAERIESALSFSEGLPPLRLRHPVRAGGSERTFEGHGTIVTGCAVTPDGRRVVSASWDDTLKVWELETGQELATLEGHGDSVTGCAVTPDGRRVVSASGDNTLKVWELETGQELATLEGHGAWVTGCAVTPDGRRVVSASGDNTLKVWELETGRCLSTLPGFNVFTAVSAGAEIVCAGDVVGNVWILETAAPNKVPGRDTSKPGLKGTMNFSFPPPLLEAYRVRKLALCVGSGISLSKGVQGNFPTWKDLPHRFLDACARYGVADSNFIQSLMNLLKSPASLEEMLSTLGLLRKKLGEGFYQKALNDIFRPKDAKPGPVHQSIARLEIPAILTTNFDPLIELAEPPSRSVYTWKESPEALHDLESDRPMLLKIHGTANRADTVVMTELEYHHARANQSYQAVLSHLFRGYTFLFLGYGMNDPLDIDLVLKRNAEYFGPAARQHYALMKQPSDTEPRAPEWDRYQREYKVQVLGFRDYRDLAALVESIGSTGP
jgi:hypothetical protein